MTHFACNGLSVPNVDSSSDGKLSLKPSMSEENVDSGSKSAIDIRLPA